MRIKSSLIVASVLMTLMGAEAGQKPDGERNGEHTAASVRSTVSETSPPAEIARIAIAGHGGDKFRNLKSLSLLGSAELYYGSNPSRPLSGKFALVQAGDRARIDIETPKFSYQEIHDGKRAYCSLKTPVPVVPPPTKFGLAVLTRFEQTGYTITALPDKENKRGFRIADSEGDSTDFYVDQATGRIMQYSFEYNGIKFMIEHKSFKEIEGVLVPYSFLRKMGLPRVDIYMEFKVKEAKVNQPIGDDVFIIPEVRDGF